MFTNEQIEKIWQKARIMPNNNPDVFRQDYAGAWIKRDQYGLRDTIYGWEIDHCKPLSRGGTDEDGNLYPLHWRNNVEKGDNYPQWELSLTSIDDNNVESKTKWHVKQ